jgi:hypothetical protein
VPLSGKKDFRFHPSSALPVHEIGFLEKDLQNVADAETTQTNYEFGEDGSPVFAAAPDAALRLTGVRSISTFDFPVTDHT